MNSSDLCATQEGQDSRELGWHLVSLYLHPKGFNRGDLTLWVSLLFKLSFERATQSGQMTCLIRTGKARDSELTLVFVQGKG